MNSNSDTNSIRGISKITHKVNVILLLMVIIVIALSSLVLYFGPSSSEAKLTGWNILGITKPQFKMIHKIFGPAFLILVINHLILNFHAILNYVKSKQKSFPSSSFAIASGILIILFVASLILGK